MSLPRDSFHDDYLVRYLLGCLPEDEVERLEEQSIVDDELAARLRLVEDDLVDAYASGRLSGEKLQRFESCYLASQRRQRKAAFAKSFLDAVDSSEQPAPSVPQPTGKMHLARAGLLSWSLAAAAVLFLGVSVLLFRDVQLRRDLTDAQRQIAAASQRATAASTELEEQRKAAAAATQALADARSVRPLATIALVLRPQTRGVGPTPLISVASGSRTVPLDLEFEAAASASYEVALKDPATNGIVWRSGPLTPQRDRRTPVVSVGVPAGLLKPQHYALDLFERRAGTTPEFVGSYAFEVARQ